MIGRSTLLKGLFLFAFLGISHWMLAQVLISGKVNDPENGMGIPGATVMVEGSTTGTITDFDGNYSITAQPGDVLIFSFVGFETVKQTVGDRTVINIDMVLDVSELSEVVVMGYSEKSRRELTASATTLGVKELKNVTSSNVENMLQGKVAGVSVTTSSGAPGTPAEIRVRGVNSLTADKPPLVVVDGMIGGTYQPNDVASITVLKDAAATALYGSLASGGVLIVTTKTGGSKSEIEFSATAGRKQITTGNFSVMNGKDLYDLQKSMWGDADYVNFLKVRPEDLEDLNYDWLGEAYHPGAIQNYYVAARGGGDNNNYSVSLDYYDEEGTLLNTGYNRISFRTNVGLQLKENVSLKTNLSIISSENNQDFWDWRYDPFLYLPWDSPYNDDGSIKYIDNTTSLTWYGRDKKNVLHSAQYNYNTWKDLSMTGNVFLTVDLTDWLTVESRNKISLYNSKGEVFYDPRTREGKSNNGTISNSAGMARDAISTLILRAEHKFGKHNISGFVGAEGNNYYEEGMSAYARNITTGLNVLGAAAETISSGGNNVTVNRTSFLSELNYSYADKYFINGVFRADASSKFSPDVRWGYFPGLSASWIASSEEFLKNFRFLDFLKLRASYGEVGNDNVGGNFAYLSYYELSSAYLNQPGGIIPVLANDQITWETLVSRNMGFDATIFSKLIISFDYYNNKTEDMLLQEQLPLSSGFEIQVRNVGSVRNQGIELSLNADVFKGKDFVWNSSINGAYNKSEILGLGKSESMYFGTDARQVSSVGQQLREWYLPKWLGVDPDNGDPLWEKVNRDENGKVISREATNNYVEAEYQAVGNVFPRVYGGWTNSLSYKGFSLNVLLSYQFGNKVYHAARQLFDNDGAYTEYNLMELQDGWSRWEKPGDKATHPLPVRGGNHVSNSVSSRYLEDGGFVRLRNVSFGYSFSKTVCETLKLHTLNVSLSGDNLYTWTKFSGLDPEARISSQAFELSGLQDFKYPISKQYLLKVSATF